MSIIPLNGEQFVTGVTNEIEADTFEIKKMVVVLFVLPSSSETTTK
jgi:hypothetical protein